MTSYEPNFWTTIAIFCRELAPISGPLLDCIGQTAAAIERAENESIHSSQGYESVQKLRVLHQNKQLTPLSPHPNELMESKIESQGRRHLEDV
ncbi:hypothetical protein [Cyanobium sp. Lug-B]|uniref:hypothetical protein n=1 Tax=Cyanobium sp. Lug-B TaxID=2823716 RepID=UPI0020CE8EEE|nr:hypothetical protein [Cyanobium sp. Lug-B]MCP9796204.1 hypothetical protein [Cyanobium sp. Lug-B]